MDQYVFFHERYDFLHLFSMKCFGLKPQATTRYFHRHLRWWLCRIFGCTAATGTTTGQGWALASNGHGGCLGKSFYWWRWKRRWDVMIKTIKGMKMKMYMMKMEMIMTKWLTNGGHMIVDHMDRRKWIAYGETMDCGTYVTEHLWHGWFECRYAKEVFLWACVFFLFAIWIIVFHYVFQFLVRPP